MSTLFLPHNALNEAADRLAARARLLVPTKEGASVVFKPYTGAEFTLERATVSPKAAALPACETLFSYSRAKQEDGRTIPSLDDSRRAEPTIIFGCRPCDARGFVIFDRPYLQGPHRDPYYAERREQLHIISLTCNAPCATCFCDWLGSGPADPQGSDILMTRLKDGLLLESVSEKGAALLEDPAVRDLFADGRARHEEALALRKASLDMRPPAPDLSATREKLAARFADLDFWREMTAHCLSCGACTYMCPTCYCFNITDEGAGLQGRRLRNWDSCMSSLFTREASGHNPRTLKALRMRNRVMHKFSFYPTVWDGVFSCSGCGRCITNCPVQLDIRRIVLAATAD